MPHYTHRLIANFVCPLLDAVKKKKLLETRLLPSLGQKPNPLNPLHVNDFKMLHTVTGDTAAKFKAGCFYLWSTLDIFDRKSGHHLPNPGRQTQVFLAKPRVNSQSCSRSCCRDILSVKTDILSQNDIFITLFKCSLYLNLTRPQARRCHKINLT